MKESQQTKPPHASSVGTQEQKIIARFTEHLERLLKIAVPTLGIVAAMGYPAVYAHFSRFGVPVHLLTYKEVLWAGVVPSVLLTATAFYFYWAAQQYRTKKKSKIQFIFIPGLLLFPLVLCTLVLVLISTLALFLLYGWAILWPFAWIIEKLWSTDISNQQLLLISLFLLIVLGGIYVLLLLTYRLWSYRTGKIWSWLGLLIRTRKPSKAERKRKDNKQSSGEQKDDDDRGKRLLQMLFIVPLMMVLMLYPLKGLFYLWNAEYSSFLGHKLIFLIGAGGGLIYVAFMALVDCSEWLSKDHKGLKVRAWVILTCLIVVLYVSAVTLYSVHVYPRLPIGLGGGSPDQITLWLDGKSTFSDLEQALPRASFFKVGDSMRSEGVYLISTDQEYLLLIDGVEAPVSVVQVTRKRFSMISWE